jgi:hypothetical protein
MSVTMARRTLAALALVALIGAGFGGCYRGFDVEDKQPLPGHAGGSCVLEDCYEPYSCIDEHQVCYDPADPCKGIYCAGYGTCGFDMGTNLPFCSCDPGYTNEVYAYFCTPIGL